MIELECIFCQIISGGRHSIIVAESQLSSAFMDIQPVNPGHALIVPRRHVSSFTELTPVGAADLMITAQKVAKGLQKVFSDQDGIPLSLADGLSAGQDVPHTHLHVVPRHSPPMDLAGDAWEGGTLELLGQQIGTAVGSDS